MSNASGSVSSKEELRRRIMQLKETTKTQQDEMSIMRTAGQELQEELRLAKEALAQEAAK
jgi:hypothetical protein